NLGVEPHNVPGLAPVAGEAANVRSQASPSPREIATVTNPDACPQCAAPRVAGAKFCPHCGCSFTGASRAAPASNAPPKAAQPAAAASAQPGAAWAGMPLSAFAGVAGGKVDVEVLEGLRSTGLVLQERPPTAAGAD